jgi:hypothetical protein
MLVGLENNYYELKVGDLVYVHYSLEYIVCYYDPATQPTCGHGVIIADVDNDVLPRYLLSSRLISVLINGEIGRYAPHEIFRISSRDISQRI